MKKINRIFIAFAGSVFLFASCGSMSDVVQAATTAAVASGAISEDAGNAIIATSEAWNQAMEAITPEQEYYIGRAVAATILTKYKTYENASLEAYLNSICMTIAINSDKPELYNGYYVKVLDTDEINAFATSGGHILITRGLLKCTESEDAIAAVIAHEIGHIHLQHSVKSIKNSRTISAITTTAQQSLVATGDSELKELASSFDSGVKEAVNTMVNNGFTKEQELEADEKALSLMNDAGYNPGSMIDMLNVLKAHSSGKTSGMSSTHPSPDTRIAAVNKLLPKYKKSATISVRTERFNSIKKNF